MHLSQLVTSGHQATEYGRRGGSSSISSTGAASLPTPSTSTTERFPMTYPGSRTSSISASKRSYPEENSPGYSHLARFPQAPLSPPEEEPNRCSLPSITSLLEGADSIDQDNAAKRQRPNPERDWDRRSLSVGSGQLVKEKQALPPTPPLRPGSGLQRQHGSPTCSTSSHTAPSSARPAGTNPSPASEAPDQRCRIPSITSSHHSTQSPLSLAPRASISEGSYIPPAAAAAAQPAIPSASPVEPPASADRGYYHRPSQQGQFTPHLAMPTPPTQQPQQHQPRQPQHQHQQAHHQHHHHHHQMATAPMAPGPGPGPSPGTGPSPAWQHHHYFPPSNAAPYPLNHDRYICRTCHKAFSRPSSLRIHSHSHTGEKPFRCPHVGCGKAFSVRSNMKRHERGCHSARPTLVS